MSSRELVALGTSSQVPTRDRSHNAYVVLWDGEGFLFDPGEGTQRQLILANIPSSRIHHICITHLHGDHCIGLTGILQRLSLDRSPHPVHIYFPESGRMFIDRLCGAAIFRSEVEVSLHPVDEGSEEMLDLHKSETCTLKSLPLEHSTPTVGYRLEEPGGRRFLPEKLAGMGIHGRRVGELRREGWIDVSGGIVRLEEVTTPCAGAIFAFVMDTRPCRKAVDLAKDADLLLMEATYTTEHQGLAMSYQHSTAADAAKTACAAGARRLALAHFSQRYPNADQHLLEARQFFPDVIALKDLDRLDIPRRARRMEACGKSAAPV